MTKAGRSGKNGHPEHAAVGEKSQTYPYRFECHQSTLEYGDGHILSEEWKSDLHHPNRHSIENQ